MRTPHASPLTAALLLMSLAPRPAAAQPPTAVDLPTVAPTPSVAPPAPPAAPAAAQAVSHTPAATGPATDEIIVTARRPLPRLDIDRSVQSATRDQIRRAQAAAATDAVAELPGVHLQATNRGAGAPVLRGLVGPQNLVAVDGIRFSNSTFRTGPNQYLALLDASHVDRIEVLLGPGSVLYGSDAMGGVVHAIAPTFDRPGPGTRAGLRFGSVDTSAQAWGEARWLGEHFGLLGGGAVRRFGTMREGGGGTEPLSAYEQDAWHVRGRWLATPTVTVDAVWLGARLRGAGRTDTYTQGRLRSYDNDSDLAWLDARWRLTGGTLREARMALSWHRTTEQVTQLRCTLPTATPALLASAADCADALRHVLVAPNVVPAAPATRHEQSEDAVRTPGVLAELHLAGWGGRLRGSVGGEAYADTVDSSRRERRGDKAPKWTWPTPGRGTFSQDSTYSSLGVFGVADADVWQDGDRKVSATAGARLARFAAHAAAVPGVGDVDYAHVGVVGMAGLRGQWSAASHVYANLSQGLRAPNLQETTALGSTGSKFEVPNAALAPEASDAVEVGARWHGDDVRVHVAGHATRIRGAIDEKPITKAEFATYGIEAADVGCKTLDDPACKPLPAIQRVNAEGGLLYGADITLEAGPWRRWVPWLHASALAGELTSRTGQVYPFRRVPPPFGTAGLRWEAADRRWWLDGFVRAATAQNHLHPSDEDDLRMCEDPARPGSTYKANQAICPGTPAWATANLRAGWQPAPGLRIDASLGNLFDARYRTHASGIEAPGRGLTVSVAGEL